MSRNYFIFDKNKCVGCEACVIACINENGFQIPKNWKNVFSSNTEKHSNLPLFNISMSCNHCEDAPCLENCPALAYSRSIITGAVLHNADACIGCKYCTWNCPYDAPKYNPFSGVINKCNFCESRLLENQKPACASLCPTGALDFSFEEIDKSAIETSLIVPVITNPSIKILELVKNESPRIDKTLFEYSKEAEPFIKEEKKITALKEWSLLLFTFIISIMVGISAVDILEQQTIISKVLFIGFGALGATLSMFHLGKPSRAWRALLNLKKSWLSREIFFFSLYFGASFIDLFFFNLPNWIIIIFGFFLLFSIDKLYSPAQLFWKTKIHSAQVLFISLSFYLLFSNFLVILALLMIIRIFMFVTKNLALNFKNKYTISLIFVRIFNLILAVLFIYLNLSFWYPILFFGIGEFASRVLFYNQLEVSDVEKAMKNGK